MKKLIFTTAFLAVALFANAQIKVITGGYVAVGSTGTTPLKPLDVIGSGGIRVSQTGSASSTNELFFQDNGQIRSWDNNHRIIFDRPNNIIELREYGDLVFSPGATSGSRTQFVTMKANGKVGIGTSTPSYQFEVYGGTNGAIYTSVAPTTNYTYGVVANATGSYPATTKLFAAQNGGTDKFYVYGSGTVWCNGTYTGSDRALKENIATLKGALNTVLKLQGVTYNYKPSVTGEQNPPKQIGLIAQDVEAVLPEVVATNDQGIKGIEYQNLVALLIEAIKEQDNKISQLRSDLDSCCSNKTGNRTINENGNGDIEQRKSEAISQIELANEDNVILYQNEPNPFDGSTVIRYFIPENVNEGAYVVFYDMYGKEVNKLQINGKGFGKIEANTEKLAGGIYSYSIVVNDKVVDTKKMIKSK